MNFKRSFIYLLFIATFFIGIPAEAYSVSLIHRDASDNSPIVFTDLSIQSKFSLNGTNAIKNSAAQWNNAGANFEFLVTTQYDSPNKFQYGYSSGLKG